jgi:hypothetical protein
VEIPSVAGSRFENDEERKSLQLQQTLVVSRRGRDLVVTEAARRCVVVGSYPYTRNVVTYLNTPPHNIAKPTVLRSCSFPHDDKILNV